MWKFEHFPKVLDQKQIRNLRENSKWGNQCQIFDSKVEKIKKKNYSEEETRNCKNRALTIYKYQ